MADSSSSEKVAFIIAKAARVNEELNELLTELLDREIEIPPYDPLSILNATEPKQLSTKIMEYPVRLANETSCDQPCMEKELNNRKRTCPHTGEFFLNSSVSTDRATRKTILHCCKDQGIKPMADDEAQYAKWIYSEPMYTQKMLIREVDKVKGMISTFLKFEVCQLLALMSSAYDCDQPEVQSGVLDIILYLSRDNEIKRKQIIENNSDVIPLLVKALQTRSLNIRSQAVKIINEISTIDPIKIRLGESNAIKALVGVLNDTTMPPNESFHALMKLFEMERNISIAIKRGVVKLLMNAIKDENHMPEMLELLKRLACLPEAVDEIVRLDSVGYLIEIVRYRKPSYWDAAVFLKYICNKYPNQLSVFMEEEQTYNTFSKLAATEIPGNKVASKILEKLKLPH